MRALLLWQKKKKKVKKQERKCNFNKLGSASNIYIVILMLNMNTDLPQNYDITILGGCKKRKWCVDGIKVLRKHKSQLIENV